ncbi:hypothetical protein ACM66B_003736 [Microbotryomycetes sp. NB124-2]
MSQALIGPNIGRLEASAPATHAEAIAVLGPILLGCCVHLVLFGVLLSVAASLTRSQAWTGDFVGTWPQSNSPERTKFQLDRHRCIKALVLLVLVLAATSAGLQVSDIWHFAMLQDRSLNSLMSGTVCQMIEPSLVGLSGAIVQSILLSRCIQIIQKSWLKRVVLIACVIMIITGFTAAVGATVWPALLQHGDPMSYKDVKPSFYNVCACWLTITAAVDVTISVIYIAGLRCRFRLAVMNQRAESAVKIVIQTCLQSAAFTAIVATGGAIVFLVNNASTESPLPLVDAGWAFFLPLPSLYALSLFTTLDVRNRLVRHLDKPGQPAKPWTEPSRRRDRAPTLADSEAVAEWTSMVERTRASVSEVIVSPSATAEWGMLSGSSSTRLPARPPRASLDSSNRRCRFADRFHLVSLKRKNSTRDERGDTGEKDWTAERPEAFAGVLVNVQFDIESEEKPPG